MARKLGISLNWQETFDLKSLIERAKIADAAGIHSIWVAETWGYDALTMLTAFAEHTSKIQLATAIVNVYSRTPAALAQHFGTLDKLSNGRMIIGLGTSSPQVVEHFHGVKFNPPLTRLKETVEIVNLLLSGNSLNYDGKLFKMSRGFKLRFEPERKHIPIWIASLNAKSVEFTARHTDGWLPSMVPLTGLAQAIASCARSRRRLGAGAMKSRSSLPATSRSPTLPSVREPATRERSPSMPPAWEHSIPSNSLAMASATTSRKSKRRGMLAAQRQASRLPQRSSSASSDISAVSKVQSND